MASTCGKGIIAGLCVYQMMPCLLSTLRAYRCTNHNLQAELQSRPPTLAPRGEWVYMYYRMLLISICVKIYYRLSCLSLKTTPCQLASVHTYGHVTHSLLICSMQQANLPSHESLFTCCNICMYDMCKGRLVTGVVSMQDHKVHGCSTMNPDFIASLFHPSLIHHYIPVCTAGMVYV